MKRLIINADDFAISHAANIAIKNCFEKGVIDSATIMVNMPGFNEAVEISKQTGMPVGLHFNLTLGKPVSKGVKSLINSDGDFFSRREFIQKYFLGKINTNHIELEYMAQVTKFMQHLKLDHVDSHQHVHMLPHIFDYVAQWCVDNKYPLRLTKQYYAKDISVNKKLRAFLLNILVSRATKKWSNDLAMNNYLVSVFDVMKKGQKPSFEMYESIMDNLPNSCMELMVHPVALEASEVDNKLTRITDISTSEYEVLMSDQFVSRLKNLKIKRILYSNLINRSTTCHQLNKKNES